MLPDIERLWAGLYFQGMRLEAEVVLHAQRMTGAVSAEEDIRLGLQQIQRSYGQPPFQSHPVLPVLLALYCAAGDSPEALKSLIKSEPSFPDPLLLWGLRLVLPSASSHAERRRRLRRIGFLLLRQFPCRLTCCWLWCQLNPQSMCLEACRTTPWPHRLITAMCRWR